MVPKKSFFRSPKTGLTRLRQQPKRPPMRAIAGVTAKEGIVTEVEPRFRWTCSYMGRQEFEVIDETGIYRVETRYEASDYERGISSYDDQGWQRAVVGAIGLLHRYHGRLDQPIPQSTVDAFDAWRLAEHEAFVKLLRDHPEKYGANADDAI